MPKLQRRRRRKATLLVDLMDARVDVSTHPTVREIATGDISGAPFTLELGGTVDDPALYIRSSLFVARMSIPELVDSVVLAHRKPGPDDD